MISFQSKENDIIGLRITSDTQCEFSAEKDRELEFFATIESLCVLSIVEDFSVEDIVGISNVWLFDNYAEVLWDNGIKMDYKI
jgi:hypothetical protein